MPEAEDRLGSIETLLNRLQQNVDAGFIGMDKRVDQLSRDLSLHVATLHTRLDDLNRRFTDLQGRLTSVEGRLSTMDTRLDTRLQGLDDRLDTRLMGVEGRLSVIEQRLDHKAGNATVNLWGATLAMLIAAATALVTLRP
jgi:predicted  nucleic acid-binding Zn-ribbon protein